MKPGTCGLDLGTTFTKAVVCDSKYNNMYRFLSTKDLSREQFLDKLKECQVNTVTATGINLKGYNLPYPLQVHTGDAITNEIYFQVKGIKKLMSFDGIEADNFLLVSVGTGTSYTMVGTHGHSQLPLGNHLGGGFIQGMGRALLLGSDDSHLFENLNRCAYNHLGKGRTTPDIMVKDVIAGSTSEFVLASCAHLSDASGQEETAYGLLNAVAVAIIKDLMMYSMAGMFATKNLVFIGGAMGIGLEALFEKYSEMLGFVPHFVNRSEFAGAMGALLELNKE